MNYNKTLETLSKFYGERVKYWTEERKCIHNAISDIEKLKRNPYSFFGRKLNKDAKQDFINLVRESWGL